MKNMSPIKKRDAFIMEVNRILRRMTISGTDEVKHVMLFSGNALREDTLNCLDTWMTPNHQIYEWELDVYIMLLSANKEETLSLARHLMTAIEKECEMLTEYHIGLTPIFLEDDQLVDIQRRVEKALSEAKKFKVGSIGYALENSVFVK